MADVDNSIEEDEPYPDLSGDKVIDTSGSYCWGLCPHCQVKNWVYLGRMDDITACDVASVRCFSCRKLSWLDENFRYEASTNRSSLEDSYYADGSPTPE